MSTYTEILTTQTDADSYIDVALMEAYRNNVLAMFEGDATASAVRLQTAALGDEIKPWIEVSQVVAAASATIDFEGLNGTYDRYIIKMDNVQPATDGVNFLLRVGTGATPTYQTGNVYGYAADHGSWNDANDTYTRTNSSSATSIRVHNLSVGNNTPESMNGTIEFAHIDDTNRHTQFIADCIGQDETGDLNYTRMVGKYSAATAVTAIRIFATSGNITAGTFTLYGIRK